MSDTVTVRRDVLKRALRKARIEYVRVAKSYGVDPGPDDECWHEFEELGEALDDVGAAYSFSGGSPPSCDTVRCGLFPRRCIHHGSRHCLGCCIAAGQRRRAVR